MNSSDPQAWRPLAALGAGAAAPAPRVPAELRARFRDAKAARLAQFLATRPTARAALRLLRGCRTTSMRPCAISGARPACRPTPRWSRSAATAAASSSPTPTSTCWCCCLRRPRRRQRRPRLGDRALHRRLLGLRARDRLERSHGRRVRDDGARRRHGADGDARVALPERRAQGVQGVRAAPSPRRWIRRRSCAPRRSRCASATRSTRTRPTRSSPTARKARAGCATCRP